MLTAPRFCHFGHAQNQLEFYQIKGVGEISNAKTRCFAWIYVADVSFLDVTKMKIGLLNEVTVKYASVLPNPTLKKQMANLRNTCGTRVKFTTTYKKYRRMLFAYRRI